eukprot:1139146-Pelagomonas_calceolata.AAC.1
MPACSTVKVRSTGLRSHACMQHNRSKHYGMQTTCLHANQSAKLGTMGCGASTVLWMHGCTMSTMDSLMSCGCMGAQ